MSYLRTTDHPIEPLFLDRWSPRSFEPEIMPDEDLLTILEAARWAPSAFNIQPWHFLYAARNGAHWDRFVGVLDDFNKAWARDASVLFVLLSDTLMPGDATRPDRVSSVNSFDAGAAWAHLALQATARGYHAHAMAGIDREHARSALAIPTRFRIEIAIAVGRRGAPERLASALAEREIPSDRKPLSRIASPGPFPTGTVGDFR